MLQQSTVIVPRNKRVSRITEIASRQRYPDTRIQGFAMVHPSYENGGSHSIVVCPNCKSELHVSNEHLGHAVQCAHCRHVFITPKRSENKDAIYDSRDQLSPSTSAEVAQDEGGAGENPALEKFLQSDPAVPSARYSTGGPDFPVHEIYYSSKGRRYDYFLCPRCSRNLVTKWILPLGKQIHCPRCRYCVWLVVGLFSRCFGEWVSGWTYVAGILVFLSVLGYKYIRGEPLGKEQSVNDFLMGVVVATIALGVSLYFVGCFVGTVTALMRGLPANSKCPMKRRR